MPSYPFAVIGPSIGVRSETFIHRHMFDLLPDRTALAVRAINPNRETDARPAPRLAYGSPRLDGHWIYHGMRYLSGLSPLDPAQVLVSRFLQQHETRVILSQYLNRSMRWMKVAKAIRARFFAHAHGYDVSASLGSSRMRTAYLQLNDADGLITVSEYSRRRLVELGLSADLIHVVPCGVDVPDASTERTVRDSTRCIAVGRMVGKKAPLSLLRSFLAARRDVPGLKLDYVGAGPLFKAARRFVDENGLAAAVTLHGALPAKAVQGLMMKADVFLQHSVTDPKTGDQEGLPVAILEAMAMSLPVISTRHAGIPEAVQDGDTGLLVDEGDVPGMAASIARIAQDTDLRQRMGLAGWARAASCYTWQRERNELRRIMGLDSL